ncbi:MAG TPA: hypothetical protein ENN81_05585 [Phycisphaerales bacterium]|mgnify:CR=1 FL=1|nr:hypothetical protein [Phycisphaerales bacterium]
MAQWLDIGVFVAFIAVVVSFSMFMSRRERNSEDYFLAGRELRWPLIGFSIVAANISTEQFVGMAGAGAGDVGLAVAGYQLLGAVTIIFVALFFLPRFLRAGNRMAITFAVVLAAMTVITLAAPLREPREMPVKQDYDSRPSALVLALGTAVIAAVVAFYIVFW